MLGDRAGAIDFTDMERHSSIRRAIADVVPGYEKLGEIDRTREEFQIAGRTFHTPRFATPSGRARFHVCPVPSFADEPGTLLTAELADSAHRIIGMGCAVSDACPVLSVPLEDWGIADVTTRNTPLAFVYDCGWAAHIAGSMAFREAMEEADPVLLEPVAERSTESQEGGSARPRGSAPAPSPASRSRPRAPRRRRSGSP